MNQYIYRTMIVPAEHVPLARSLAEGLAGAPGAGMWTTGLSASGEGEPTHYVSSGVIEDTFADLIVDAQAMHAATQQAGFDVPLELLQQLVDESTVTDGTAVDDEGNSYTESPHALFARLGLMLVSEST